MTVLAPSVEAEVLEQQTHLLELIASGCDSDRILTQLARSLESLLPGSSCSILLVDAERLRLRHGAAPSLSPAYSRAIDGIAIRPGNGSCGSAAALGRLVAVRDTETDPSWSDFRALAREHGLRACWSSPVSAPDGSVLGTFAVYHREAHHPTERDVALLERFSALAAVAIRHAAMLRTVAESEERFRRAFEDNAAGMALVDLDGRLVRVNPAFATVVGAAAAELPGLPLAALLHPVSRGAVDAAIAGLVGNPPGGRHLEVGILRRDGGEASALLGLSAVRDPDGVPCHGCVNLIDDTERRRAEARRSAAEAARAVAEERSLASGQLLSAMSHELRTPMSSIVGFCELLRSVDLPADRRDAAVAHLAEASEHLLGLVEDLLDLAKLDAGASRVRTSIIDVVPVVAEAVGVLEPLAREHGVRIAVDDPGRPVHGHADPKRLRQALFNLVANAVKYNHEGGAVQAACATLEDRVRITIQDTGPGLPEQAVDRLFTPFDRLGAESSTVPGTGLGLAISKQLVEAMGGRLVLLTGGEAGTTAIIELAGAGTATDD